MTKKRDRAKGYRLAELSEKIGTRLVGDPNLTIFGVAHPRTAGADDLALALDEASYSALEGSKAKAAAIAREPEETDKVRALLIATRGRLALARLLALFEPELQIAPGIHPSAVVEPSAVIGAEVRIGPLAYIGPAARIGARTRILAQASVGGATEIGEDCIIHSGARVGERVRIGNRVILHANAAIGADGYSYTTPEIGSIEAARLMDERVRARNTEIVKIPSLGSVEIGDEVEIGACSTVDRATLGVTRIGQGTKIDDQVHIAHNCVVGENCLIVGKAALAGSVRLGNRVVMGGAANVSDHFSVGDDAIVMAGSAVVSDIPAEAIVIGVPAVRKLEYYDQLMNLRRMKGLIRDLERLKSQMKEVLSGQYGSRLDPPEE